MLNTQFDSIKIGEEIFQLIGQEKEITSTRLAIEKILQVYNEFRANASMRGRLILGTFFQERIFPKGFHEAGKGYILFPDSRKIPTQNSNLVVSDIYGKVEKILPVNDELFHGNIGIWYGFEKSELSKENDSINIAIIYNNEGEYESTAATYINHGQGSVILLNIPEGLDYQDGLLQNEVSHVIFGEIWDKIPDEGKDNVIKKWKDISQDLPLGIDEKFLDASKVSKPLFAQCINELFSDASSLSGNPEKFPFTISISGEEPGYALKDHISKKIITSQSAEFTDESMIGPNFHSTHLPKQERLEMSAEFIRIAELFKKPLMDEYRLAKQKEG